jgi:hypothetical protein
VKITPHEIGRDMKIRAPKLRRLYQDWERRRNGRPFPARAAFDPSDLVYILGDLSLIDVIRDGSRLDFCFRLYGSSLTDHFGRELTGKSVDDIRSPEQAKLARAHFEEVVAAAVPVAYLRNRYFFDCDDNHDCEVLVLPLSSDGMTIDMLMSAFGWEI